MGLKVEWTYRTVKFVLLAILAVFAVVMVELEARGPHGQLKTQPGYTATVWARDLGDARIMVAAPDGGVLVSTYRDGAVLWARGDHDGDGRSDGTVTLIKGLDRPHGLVLEDKVLYVAEQHRVVRYDFDGKSLTNPKTILKGIPQGAGHSSRTLVRGPDGWLYLSVGSSCNVCIEKHPWRAAIVRFKEGTEPQVFATGLRNSVGLAFRPGENALYATNAGRDHLGDDKPREELNRVVKGGHYGWPYVHGNAVKDPKYWSRRPKDVKFLAPVHTFTAHSTPLSIRFVDKTTAYVARHGSWNRSTPSGYDVLKLTFKADGTVTEMPFVTGFRTKDETLARPVDTLPLPDGSVLVSDDEEGLIFRIAPVK